MTHTINTKIIIKNLKQFGKCTISCEGIRLNIERHCSDVPFCRKSSDGHLPTACIPGSMITSNVYTHSEMGFIILHEIAHIIIHDEIVFDDDLYNKRLDMLRHNKIDPLEQQADLWAYKHGASKNALLLTSMKMPSNEYQLRYDMLCKNISEESL